ncbi:MAG: hypothetical protein HY920_08055 [Elusimicrobia bacterium]|nr:hypothetical protein [Elusimicrobiota bacterium]
MSYRNRICLFMIVMCILGRAGTGSALSVEKVFIVSQVNKNNTADTLAKNILKKDTCALYLVIKARESGKVIYFSDVQRIKIDDYEIIPKKPGDYIGQIDITWFKVEPEMYHLTGRGHDPVNPWFLWYTNAGAPGGKTDRQPLSVDKITYRENQLVAENNKWTILADAHPTDPEYDIHDGLGTMRYGVVIEYKDVSGARKRLGSPGMERYANNGISNEVCRVTVQQDVSYLGYLTGYFNVPGVFGSYPAQVDNYVGVDCADLVVGGWNKYKGKRIPYTNVTGLRYSLPTGGLMKLILSDHYYDSDGIIYAKYNDAAGAPADQKIIKIGQNGIHPGDIILFNYIPDKADRSWDHVGILYADSSENGTPNGLLDKYDLILHCGPSEPRINQFNYEGFVSLPQATRFAVVRWIE